MRIGQYDDADRGLELADGIASDRADDLDVPAFVLRDCGADEGTVADLVAVREQRAVDAYRERGDDAARVVTGVGRTGVMGGGVGELGASVFVDGRRHRSGATVDCVRGRLLWTQGLAIARR